MTTELSLIYIQWVDCWEPDNSWRPIDDIRELVKPEFIVDQVGWVMSEDDKYVVMLNMIMESAELASHATKIPKYCIIYREEIRLKRGSGKEVVHV